MSTPAQHVIVAGGGIAALEAAIALRELAGARLQLTLVSPRADFVLTPLTVGEPFSIAHARRRPLADIAAELGARHVDPALRGRALEAYRAWGAVRKAESL
jgi:sulfide:quinone oxidoreductase